LATSTTDVVIPANTKVVLSGCTLPGNALSVRSITIPAGTALIVADTALSLNIGTNIVVNGTFSIGGPSCPIYNAITVTIPGGNAGYGVIVNQGGKLDIHGTTYGLPWTRISVTVPVGAKTLPLQEAVAWKSGDKIALASTFWKDEFVNQNEVLTVASVSADGKTVSTVEGTQFVHYGGGETKVVSLLQPMPITPFFCCGDSCLQRITTISSGPPPFLFSMCWPRTVAFVRLILLNNTTIAHFYDLR
jgi:hypothetical protein